MLPAPLRWPESFLGHRDESVPVIWRRRRVATHDEDVAQRAFRRSHGLDLNFLGALLAHDYNLHDRLGRVTGVGLLQEATGLLDGRCANARVFGSIQSPLRLEHLRAV